MNMIMAFNNNIIPDTNYRARMGKHLGGILKLHAVFDRHAPLVWSLSFADILLGNFAPEPYFRGCLNYRESPTMAQFVTHGGRGPHFLFGLIFLIGSLFRLPRH